MPRPATAFAARWRRAARPTPAPAGWADVRLGAFSRPDNLRWESRTLADVMDETRPGRGRCHLRPAAGREPAGGPGHQRPVDRGLRHFVPHPAAMVGTDSTFLGEKPSPRTYGSFPRILGQFVRDERLLSLEEAVRKMTGAPAARLGLRSAACCATASRPTWSSSTRRASAPTRPTTSRDNSPMGSSTSSSTASWWWTAAAHRRAAGAGAARSGRS